MDERLKGLMQELGNAINESLSDSERIAEAIGEPGGSRAVGNAVGRNPISWLIPCHRVLRSTGALGGYAWGPDRKRVMLTLERVQRAERTTPAAPARRAS